MIDISKSVKSRSKQFNRLIKKAIILLKQNNYPISPDFILDTQETLAIQSGLVPPHWSGFVLCDNCGCMPADQGIAYKKTSSCSFCHLNDEQKTEISLIANANRLEYWKEIKKINPPPEIDMTDFNKWLSDRLKSGGSL